MKTKDKNKKWIKFRHKIVTKIGLPIITLYSKMKYGIRIDKFKDNDRQYLILYNHQTAFDQFFVGMPFKNQLYYVASEDLFSKGKLSSVIRYLVAPIPIKKQTTDVRAILDCMKVAREGGSIAIAPEGNRTFSGKNCYMNPAIAPLARKLGLPIALFRLEGGYGVHPRWSDALRKGNGMRGYVSRVVEPEEYAPLSDAELYGLIERELYVNECEIGGVYPSKRSAEYLERAYYVCPSCGLSEFHSEGDTVTCKKCKRAVKYLPDKTLMGIGFAFPFKNTVEWYDYQCNFVSELDLSPYFDEPMYTDSASVYEVALYKNKLPLGKSCDIKLYGNRITVSKDCEFNFPFDEVSAVTVLGRNKLNIYHNKKVYQIKGDKRMNALKFVNIFYAYKGLQKGDKNNGKFLGL